ncbi:hypothetical protein [Streptomyces sp. NPDC001843]|uniref:hypothetical protein n=1 Tax=Streptomyces sp. NPDC001843 TaxID=3364617 RepID=UPI00368DBE4B
MRKFHKVAVVAAMLGSVGFLGAGVSQAHGDDDATVKLENKQNQHCSADGTEVAGTKADPFAPILLGTGFQYNDKSEHKSVTCTQIFTVGK